MKVLLLNSSPRLNGTTWTALNEVAKTLELEGIETELVQLGGANVRDCIACGRCRELGRCVFDDDQLNEFVEKARTADGFVFGSPVYYAHPSGRLLSCLDRAFISGSSAFAHKPGAAVVAARRAGTTASFDAINKHFTIAQMPIVSSTYWNNIHGSALGEANQDAEGMQTMRNLARNMAWLLKCIELGRQAGVTAPQAERTSTTNFIR